MKIGLIHPGLMGVSIGAVARCHQDVEVIWSSEGRSGETRERAEKQGFTDVGNLFRLVELSDLIISVCPPHAAETVAAQVAELKFSGLYVDANAISPQRSLNIEAILSERGVDFVDGGIIGPPAWGPGTTWLHLSGTQADTAKELLSHGNLQCNVLGRKVGQASALKMCFAAFTKGSTALLCAILATAEKLEVRDALISQWSNIGNGLDQRAPRDACNVTQKAWRFVGEMEEISETFRQAGLPGGFHEAAAEVYRRMSQFKEQNTVPELDAVLSVLNAAEDDFGPIRAAGE